MFDRNVENYIFDKYLKKGWPHKNFIRKNYFVQNESFIYSFFFLIKGEWTTLSWENVPGGGKGNGAGNGRKWLATAGGWSLAIITMLLPSAIRALMGVDVV